MRAALTDMTMRANSVTVARVNFLRMGAQDTCYRILPNVAMRRVGSQAILNWGSRGIEGQKEVGIMRGLGSFYDRIPPAGLDMHLN